MDSFGGDEGGHAAPPSRKGTPVVKRLRFVLLLTFVLYLRGGKSSFSIAGRRVAGLTWGLQNRSTCELWMRSDPLITRPKFSGSPVCIRWIVETMSRQCSANSFGVHHSRVVVSVSAMTFPYSTVTDTKPLQRHLLHPLHFRAVNPMRPEYRDRHAFSAAENLMLETFVYEMPCSLDRVSFS